MTNETKPPRLKISNKAGTVLLTIDSDGQPIFDHGRLSEDDWRYVTVQMFDFMFVQQTQNAKTLRGILQLLACAGPPSSKPNLIMVPH